LAFGLLGFLVFSMDGRAKPLVGEEEEEEERYVKGH
jgi:hypothetical protein